jgi:alkylation response protein AidB-like acyl-CoA dehydrogenase
VVSPSSPAAAYGGHEAPRPVTREYLEILAAACGLTNFVQQQHLSACRLIADGENEALKASVLPALARGDRLCGVAFSHLRRPGPPILRAVPQGDGWVFDGVAPWFTGWGLMHEVVLGGTLPDGRLLYVHVPLDVGETLQASPPLRLCTFDASGTVALACRGLRVERAGYVKTTAAADLAASDRENVLEIAPQAFGVARAALELVRELAASRPAPVLAATADTLEAELAAARRAVDAWHAEPAEAASDGQALATRAWCLELAVRAAHAAVAASGGSANSRDHTAQRLFREAMVYSLLMQTQAAQAATLGRLAASARAAATSFAGAGSLE